MHTEARARHAEAAAEKARRRTRSGEGASRRWTWLMGTCALVAVAAGAVAITAWERPVRGSRTLQYVQSGRFAYDARTSAGSVYGSGGLRTGQPVYTAEVTALRVRFSYRFRAGAPWSIKGRGQLLAVMSNGQGISRRFVLQPVTAFDGSSFSLAGTVQVSRLNGIARAFAVAAGTSYAGSGYVLTVEPVVQVQGRVGTVGLRTSFAPSFSFSYTQDALLPAASMAAAAGGPAATAQGGSPSFAPTAGGQLRVPGARPATYLVAGLTVPEARWGSLGTLVLALLVGALATRGAARRAEAGVQGAWARARLGQSAVEVGTLPDYPVVAVVEMAALAGLVQVGRKLECPVLVEGGPRPTYAVVDSGTLYRYRPPEVAVSAKGPDRARTAELRLSSDGASRD